MTQRNASEWRNESLRPPQVEGYEILEELGRGGMGVVYRARQISLGRIVALKVMISGQYASREMVARFENEARAIASLQHRGIVQIFAVGTSGEFPFISLEFVPNGSLADWMSRHSLSARESAELSLSLAKAIHAAHQAGIIHRDLKPANVLLTEDGQPKITDFGIAKNLMSDSRNTRTGEIMGTPSYMAPEQAGGVAKASSPQIDVYALGAILYEMLTGRPPFRGQDPVETVLAVLTQDPVTVRRLAPRIPRDLETICHKCLSKLPRKRYESAQALADDLQRFLDGRAILARPTSLMERTGKWIRRRPTLAALIMVSCISVVAFIVIAVWNNRHLASALSETETALQRSESNLRKAISSAARRISRQGDTSIDPLREELKFFEVIRQQTGDAPAPSSEKALAASWSGTIYGKLNQPELAEQAFWQAIELLASLNQEFPDNDVYTQDLATARARYAIFLTNQSRFAEAKTQFDAALPMMESLAARADEAADVRWLLAVDYNNLGVLLSQMQADPEPAYRRAISIREALVRDFPQEPVYQYDLAVSRLNWGARLMRAEEFAEAESVLRSCLVDLDSLPTELRADEEYRRSTTAAHLNLAHALAMQQKNDEATQTYVAGLAVVKDWMQNYPFSVAARSTFIDGSKNMAKFLINMDDLPRAMSQLKQAVAVYDKLILDYPRQTGYQDERQEVQEAIEQIQAVLNEEATKLDCGDLSPTLPQ